LVLPIISTREYLNIIQEKAFIQININHGNYDSVSALLTDLVLRNLKNILNLMQEEHGWVNISVPHNPHWESPPNSWLIEAIFYYDFL
jgi:hypothetical protein